MGRLATAIGHLGYWLWSKGDMAPRVSDMLGTDIQPWDSIYGKDPNTRMYGKAGLSYDQLIQKYTSWVYACANKNAVAVAQIPLRLYGKKRSTGTKFRVATRPVSREKKDWLFKQPQLITKLADAVDVEEITEHPFLDLLSKVNPFMNGFELSEYWTLYQELTGNSYTLIVKNGLGTPQELWVLQPQQMKIVPDKQSFIKGYLYGRNRAKAIAFEPDEIIHMKYANPQNMFYGMGPLAAAAIAADAGVAMNVHEYSLLKNNAIPPSALETEQSMTPDQIKRVKTEWNAAYRGPEKAGRLAIFQGGLKPSRLSLTPKEMGYLTGRKITTEEIAAIFGVPMSKLKVGDVKAAPAAGMYYGNITYQRDTIQPKLRRIDQKLNEQLLPMYDDKLFCAFDNPVGEDKDFRLKERESNLKNGYSSINQERLRDNQEAVPWGDVPILPTNVMPLGDEVPSSTQSSFSLSFSDGGRANMFGPASVYKFLDPDDLPRPKDSLAGILRQIFRRQRTEIAGKMPKGLTQLDRALTQHDTAKAVGDPSWLLNEDKWNKELARFSKTDMAKLVDAGGKRGMRQLGLGLSFDVDSPETQAFVKKHSFKFASAVNKETNDKLRLHFAQGLEAGETVIELRQRVMEKVFGNEITRNRAEMIARTESARAMMAGTEQAWKSAGVVVSKEWNGASDMCEFCQAMNAQFGPGTGGISLGGTFVDGGTDVQGVDGGVLSMNYGPVNYPPIHPNCLLPGQTVYSPDGFLAGSTVWYNGPVIDFLFADGNHLSVTPNHMLLTPNGFVAAHTFVEGDNVFYCPNFERHIPSSGNNNNHPTKIEQIFEAFTKSSKVDTLRLQASSEDFHGDGGFCEGDVDIVRANGFLGDTFKPSLFQERQQSSFGGTNIDSIHLLRTRALTAFLETAAAAAHSIMGRRSELSAFDDGHPTYAHTHTFSQSSRSGVALLEPAVNNVTRNTKVFSQLLNRYSGLVAIQPIITIRHFDFCGHVYDLQSPTTLYLANGIVSSNCRCDLLPVIQEA